MTVAVRRGEGAFAYLTNRGAMSYDPESGVINRMVGGHASSPQLTKTRQTDNRAQISFASPSAKPM